MACPDSQSPNLHCVDKRPHIIIFAESGLLAGDLAAWLSGRFVVERVTSLPGAVNAVGQGARALILVGADQQPLTAGLQDLVERCLAARCGVILLGGDFPGQSSDQSSDHSSDQPAAWRGRVCTLGALPDPAEVFAALNKMVQRADEGRA